MGISLIYLSKYFYYTEYKLSEFLPLIALMPAF